MTAPPDSGFERLALQLTEQAARIARARRAEQRAGDAHWRSPRLLWPNFTSGD
ncbi:MAG: hypothetical protein ABGW87_09030 [Sphingomonadaceae bacterium]